MKIPLEWSPPSGCRRVRTIDLHTEGEPLRLVVEGFPELLGDDQLARRRDARARFDHLRTALAWEPRGHADMYGCLPTPPASPGADLGVLFFHNEGWSTMCGHAIIAVAKVAAEAGLGERDGDRVTLRIDTPAGRVTAWARLDADRVGRVCFENVPSFVAAEGGIVAVPGIGEVRYDLAFGGAFYAYVEAAAVGLALEPASFRALIDAGLAIKRAVAGSREIRHPLADDLGFLYGVVFTGSASREGRHSRHVCVFAEGEVDRSPTGTGVSARLALLHASGELAVDQPIVIESILGTAFGGRVARTTRLGPYAAVVPEVDGRAWVTGRHEFLIDPDDPLRDGFILR